MGTSMVLLLVTLDGVPVVAELPTSEDRRTRSMTVSSWLAVEVVLSIAALQAEMGVIPLARKELRDFAVGMAANQARRPREERRIVRTLYLGLSVLGATNAQPLGEGAGTVVDPTGAEAVEEVRPTLPTQRLPM